MARRGFAVRRLALAGGVGAAIVLAGISVAQNQERLSGSGNEKRRFQAQLGPDSPKIKREGGKVLVWAGPREHPPDSAGAEWYDFSGAPFPPEELQFGIGQDSIRAIDDPLFVKPDDPRLLKYIGPSPYRPAERPTINDEIPVIGYVNGGEARAYPVALLDGHELVNDRVGGRPVTVGW